MQLHLSFIGNPALSVYCLIHSTQYKYLDTQSVVVSVQILNKILLHLFSFTLSISVSCKNLDTDWTNLDTLYNTQLAFLSFRKCD